MAEIIRTAKDDKAKKIQRRGCIISGVMTVLIIVEFVMGYTGLLNVVTTVALTITTFAAGCIVLWFKVLAPDAIKPY